MGDSHLNAILATIRSGEFSDLSFVGEEKTFFVHKAIVCPQSEVLKEAVQAVPTVVSLHLLYLPHLAPAVADKTHGIGFFAEKNRHDGFPRLYY